MQSGTVSLRPLYDFVRSDPDASGRNIESDPIEILNQLANAARPVPPKVLHEHTKKVIGEFRRLIHEHRIERQQ